MGRALGIRHCCPIRWVGWVGWVGGWQAASWIRMTFYARDTKWTGGVGVGGGRTGMICYGVLFPIDANCCSLQFFFLAFRDSLALFFACFLA